MCNFKVEESPYGYFMIYNQFVSPHFNRIKDSARVIEARLFNLSFANYCRMCRDKYGAKIYGQAPYFLITFPTMDTAAPLAAELNKRWVAAERSIK